MKRIILSVNVPFTVVPLVGCARSQSLVNSCISNPIGFTVGVMIISLVITLGIVLMVLALSNHS